jgi:hypothetical protein
MEEVMNGNKGLFAVSFSFFFMLFGMIAAMMFVGVEKGHCGNVVEYRLPDIIEVERGMIVSASVGKAVEMRMPEVKVSNPKVSNPGVARERPAGNKAVGSAVGSVVKKVCIHHKLGHESIKSVSGNVEGSRLGGRKVGVRYNFSESAGVELCE